MKKLYGHSFIPNLEKKLMISYVLLNGQSVLDCPIIKNNQIGTTTCTLCKDTYLERFNQYTKIFDSDRKDQQRLSCLL